MKRIDAVTTARALLGTAFVAWTAYWGAAALPQLAATTLGTGAWRPSLEAHEVLEAFFTLSHSGIRWLPLALVMVGVFVWLGRLSRPEAPRRADATA